MPRFSSAVATLSPGSRASFSACAWWMRPLRGCRSPTLPPSPWPPSSSRFATPRSVGARSQLRRELRSGTCSSAWISWPRGGSPSATTWRERRSAPVGGAAAGDALKWGLERAGGYGGDFPTVLASLRRANRADVVFSTVDTVGIPLMLLARAGACRCRSCTWRSAFRSALRSCGRNGWSGCMRRRSARARTVIAYSQYEADELRRWLERRGFRRESSSCLSGSTPRPSRRCASRRHSTSSRSEHRPAS